MGAAAAALPLLYLVVYAGEAGWAQTWDVLWRERTFRLLINSIGLTAAVTASCLAIGVPTAWLVTRTDLPARRAWMVIAALPLAVPSYVAAYGWIASSPGLHGFLPTWLILNAVSTP